MSANESFLDNHVRLLLESDENFRRYWSEFAERERQGVLLLASEIDQCGSRELNIIADHERASRELARYMVRIQEREFDYLRIPRDWLDFVHSDSEKVHVYQQVERLLLDFWKARNSDQQ